MIKGRDIVIIGIQPWDIPIGSNCKNIAEEFARHNRVLYVNEPLNRITRYRNRKEDWVRRREEYRKGYKNNLQQVQENLWTFYPKRVIESINWLPDSPLYRSLNYRNNGIFYAEIKKAIAALGFGDFILFNDSLIALGLYSKEMLAPELAIYYIRDNLISQPYFARHGVKAEAEIARKYDAVVANSEFLAAYLRPHNPLAEMVGQGCDFSLFDTDKDWKEPEDIKNLPRPVIGYVGFLTAMRLDLRLLEYIAQVDEEWSLVLVGPEDEDFKRSVLHNTPNVYFLGNKESHELPAYISTFDVAINPQVVNAMTIGNYPRKIDEYLAMGKPVVATHTQTMEYFKDYIYLARDKEEFIQLLRQAREENSIEKVEARMKFARSHTWENNVKNIYQVMEKALTEQNSTARHSDHG